MSQQEKRGPGRPRKVETRRHIDITLSPEVLTELDKATNNRSLFIERLLRRELGLKEVSS